MIIFGGDVYTLEEHGASGGTRGVGGGPRLPKGAKARS